MAGIPSWNDECQLQGCVAKLQVLFCDVLKEDRELDRSSCWVVCLG